MTGPAINRASVPKASNVPIWSGESPRVSKNIGQKGDATPNAAYITPYSVTKATKAWG